MTFLTTFSDVNGRYFFTALISLTFYRLCRCPVDEKTSIFTKKDKKTEWKTEAYRYLFVSSDAVYVECIVRICLATDQSVECSQCSSRKRRESKDDGKSLTGETAFIKSPIFYIADNGIYNISFPNFLSFKMYFLLHFPMTVFSAKINNFFGQSACD